VTNIHKILSRGLCLRGQIGADLLFTISVIFSILFKPAQRHYLAKIMVFTIQRRGFIAQDMTQGWARGGEYLFV
jgi:hypothetical protein